MADYDEVIRWSDLGRPDEPLDIDNVYLGGFVLVEQKHIDEASRLGGNPDVLVKEDSDPGLAPIKTWLIVGIADEGSYIQ